MTALTIKQLREKLQAIGFVRQPCSDRKGPTWEASECWVRRTKGTEALHILTRMTGWELIWNAESAETLLKVLES